MKQLWAALKSIGLVAWIIQWFLRRSDARKPQVLRDEIRDAVITHDKEKANELLQRGLHRPDKPAD